MKLAFVTSKALSRHATIKRAWGMAPHLLEKGVEVSVVCEDCEENRATVSGIAGLGALYYSAGLPMQAERKAKASLLQQLQPDLVHICGLGWRNAVDRRCLRGTVIMDHVELESSIPNTSWLRRAMQVRLERWSFNHYSGSIVASKYLEFEVRRTLLLKRVHKPILWLPFAFDEHSFKPEPGAITALRMLAGGRKTIAFMGGLYLNYGICDLLEAYRKSEHLAKIARLVFVGRGPEADYLKSQRCGPGPGPWIDFSGYLDEKALVSFLFASDVLVSPLADTIQDWARCPSKTYMYMATRRPIVTSCIGENREALGNFGFYYQPNSPETMTDALIRAVGHIGTVDYELSAHTWETRTNTYLQWLSSAFRLIGC